MTTSDGPRCSHPDCDTRVETGRFACPTHWFALPRTIRNRIWATWRAYLGAPDADRSLAAWARYETAAGDAKAHWIDSEAP